MERERIADWMEREHGISFIRWNQMVDLACDRYLKEIQSAQGYNGPVYLNFADHMAREPIGAEELGGTVERVLAAAYGWTTYVSKED